MSLDKLQRDVMNSAPAETVVVNINNNPAINNDILFSAIENKTLDSISDDDLYHMVLSMHTELFRKIMSKDSRYVVSCVNPKLLKAIIAVCGNIIISEEERIICNKIVYDYMTSQNPNEITKGMVMQLSRSVNKDILPSLLGLGLDIELASYLATARFSSTNMNVCVMRVNFVIMTQPNRLMTEQMILNIFEILYDRFTEVFIASMLETLDEDSEWVTDNIKENYATISLVLLDILNVMPSDNIQFIINSYCDNYKLLHYGKPVRFNLEAISGEFYRITQQIEILKSQGIEIPR